MCKNKQTIKYTINNKKNIYIYIYSSRENLVAELLIKVIGKSFHQSVAFGRKNFLLKDKW